MEETTTVITDQLLAGLTFKGNFPHTNYNFARESRLTPDTIHANSFQESIHFIKMFSKFLQKVNGGVKTESKNPLDSIKLRKVNSEDQLYSIEKDIIPFLKESKRTLQIISRNKKTAFGTKLSNEVLLGEFLEDFTPLLNKTICNISNIFDVNKQFYTLPKWTETFFYKKILEHIPNKILKDTDMQTRDVCFDTLLFFDPGGRRIDCPTGNRFYYRSVGTNELSNLENKDYIRKAFICILENIYFYLSIFLGIYYNYLIGAGALYDKKKDRHRITIPDDHNFSGLACIPYGYQGVTSGERISSFAGILGVLFSSIDNIQQTAQENILNIKLALSSIASIKQESLKEGFKELNKINNIFMLFKNLSDLLYTAFMMGSPLENTFKACKKQEALSDVFVPLAQYIYNDFNGIDPKLVEKISFESFKPLNIIRTVTTKCRNGVFTINKRNDVERPEFTASDFNAHEPHASDAYIILAVLGSGTLEKLNNESFLDYWVNKAEKPLIALSKEEVAKDSKDGFNGSNYYGAVTVNSIQRVFDTYIDKADKFTGENIYTNPFDFKLLSTQIFPIIPPGARNYEQLAKREITLQEKIGISLIIFGPSIQRGREDDNWRMSSVPELGVKISHAK